MNKRITKDEAKKYWVCRGISYYNELESILRNNPTDEECLMAMTIEIALFNYIINPSEEVTAHYQFYTL